MAADDDGDNDADNNNDDDVYDDAYYCARVSSSLRMLFCLTLSLTDVGGAAAIPISLDSTFSFNLFVCHPPA